MRPGSRGMRRGATRAPIRQADQLAGLGAGSDDAPRPLVQVVRVLVEQGGQRAEPDERHGKERHCHEDAAKALDLPAHPPRLGIRRRCLLGGDRELVAPGEAALVAATDRLAQPQSQHDEHDRRNGEHEERRAPPEPVGEQPGHDRPEDRPDRIGRPMEAVHLRALVGGEPIGEQRVVGRVVDRLADGRSRAGDPQHHDAGGEARHEGEARPHHGACQRDAYPREPVRHSGDRNLEREGERERPRRSGSAVR